MKEIDEEDGAIKEQAELIPSWANDLIKTIELNQSVKIMGNQQPQRDHEHKKDQSRRIGR